ncbi:hypothetical protein TYRP_001925 [Tyrophagus putrescentiae]|nr:hypothetical protein TYRP_001925 [Tyrophagus putrescentiae]
MQLKASERRSAVMAQKEYTIRFDCSDSLFIELRPGRQAFSEFVPNTDKFTLFDYDGVHFQSNKTVDN